jgi:hypothetical protein
VNLPEGRVIFSLLFQTPDSTEGKDAVTGPKDILKEYLDVVISG